MMKTKLGQEKNLWFWSIDFWPGTQPKFSNLINVNMQTWLPMQRWQPGGVRCWMSGAGPTYGVPGMGKAR